MSDSSLSFEGNFRKSWRYSSSAGNLCQFIGISGPILGLIMTIVSIQKGDAESSPIFLIVSLLLLISGAPIIALGTIANQLKKQTALIALQTWESQRKDNPDIGQFRLSNYVEIGDSGTSGENRLNSNNVFKTFTQYNPYLFVFLGLLLIIIILAI